MLIHTWLQHGTENQSTGLLLVLLNLQLPLFQDWLEGNGTLQTKGCTYMTKIFFHLLSSHEGL